MAVRAWQGEEEMTVSHIQALHSLKIPRRVPLTHFTTTAVDGGYASPYPQF